MIKYKIKGYDATINLSCYKDGDQWCVLFGKDLQEGICGFGASILEALAEFETKFYK